MILAGWTILHPPPDRDAIEGGVPGKPGHVQVNATTPLGTAVSGA
jgi:hypothetical protein